METERLLLRRWKDSDREPMRRMNADPKVMEFYPHPLLPDKSDQIITKTEASFEKEGFGLWAMELKATGEFAGFVGLQWVPFQAHFTPTIEIGWRVPSSLWNRGYATEGARRIIDFAFSELKREDLVAMTFTGNHRSRRVMEKLGMTYDPKDDFLNPHPALKDTHLVPHVLYRLQAFDWS